MGVNGEDDDRVDQVMNHMAYAFSDVNNTQEALMAYFKRKENWTVKERIPFSSDRKYRAIRFATQGCFVLGAPDFLLDEE